VKITKVVTQGLSGLLFVCLIVRVGAWLVQPVIPMLAVMFVVAAIVERVVGRRT
jgi:CHASE2 domain-containing sensor protein